jgi:hypothetical protein
MARRTRGKHGEFGEYPGDDVVFTDAAGAALIGAAVS